MTQKIVFDLLIILFAGFAAGVVCRALRAPLLVGYIIVGAMLGDGCLGLIVADRGHEIELFAEAGALLLLFSVGLEFSLEELSKLRRHIFLGGSAQMVLVAVPLTLTACWFGIGIEAALLLGVAGALSSTVLVFKALSEYGQLTLPAGRRAIGILLFQDIALVPILLLVPLLTGQNQSRDASDYAYFVINSFILIAMIPLLRTALQRWIAPWLSAMRSPELIVLFVISLIGMLTLAAYLAGLPAPLGAFAAGLVLNGNRISGQIDALILSFREVFAVVFFVSLGVLFNPDIISQSPLVILIAFIGLLLVKSFAGTIAVRITGLQWRASIGSGIGLAQIGEFAFILGLSGLQAGLLTQKDYDYLLVFALGSLLLTPLMLKFGLRWSQADDVPGEKSARAEPWNVPDDISRAVVIGIGHIGRQLALHLETRGVFVCAVDLSALNVHALAQQGFATVVGNAQDYETLERAHLFQSQVAIVCVPEDTAAIEIVKTIRSSHPQCTILVRCRYRLTSEILKSAGAHFVIVEESQSSIALIDVLTEKEII